MSGREGILMMSGRVRELAFFRIIYIIDIGSYINILNVTVMKIYY